MSNDSLTFFSVQPPQELRRCHGTRAHHIRAPAHPTVIQPTSHALLRAARHGENVNHPCASKAALRPTAHEDTRPRAERLGRARHQHRPPESQGLCANPAIKLILHQPRRKVLMPAVQAHHPRRGRQHDGRCTGSAPADD